MINFEFVLREDGDADVIAGDAVIELSRDEHGDWRFWNVRVGDQCFGGNQYIGPGEFTSWLDEQFNSAVIERSAA